MHYRQYKSILSPQNRMNIYRGCTHGCIYCDSRSECYSFAHPFEDIEVKQNAVQLLESELIRKRKKCVISTGSMSDPYMHAENELMLTRKCAELADRHGFGFTFLTKSAGFLRDIDIFRSINEKSKCTVQMTLTSYDEDLCGILEPSVSSSRQRFQALTELKKCSIPSVVWICPVLPFINDTQENLRGLLEYCAEAGVYGILCFGFGVTLREGSRDYFYRNLDEYFPGMKERYIKTFGNSYFCMSPENDKLTRTLHSECARLGIVCDNRKIFEYLGAFEEKGRSEQLTFF